MRKRAPRRWHEVTKRIDYLLKKHNLRNQHKMRHEHDLGLWDEQADFHYKENVRRSYDSSLPHSKSYNFV